MPTGLNEYCVQPLNQAYQATDSSGVEASRPKHEWVQKTSERLAEEGGAARSAFGAGGRAWAAAAGTYDRTAKHAPVKHQHIPGVEALGEGVAAAVGKELGAAKNALGITDPGFHPERFTMVVMGRPVQVLSASTMFRSRRAVRRLLLFLVHMFLFSKSHNIFVSSSVKLRVGRGSES